MLETLTTWVLELMTNLGYPGLALVMFLENIFPPIPSEIILPLAGSMTLAGPFTLPEVVLAGTAGSVAGAWLFYALGRHFDESFLRRMVRTYGRWFLVNETDLNTSIAWFHRYGDWVVLFCRMVPLVRSLISIPAGMAHMNGVKFTLYTLLGTAGWSLALALAGRLLNHGWRLVSDFIGRFQDLTVALLVILILGFLLGRLGQQLHLRFKRL